MPSARRLLLRRMLIGACLPLGAAAAHAGERIEVSTADGSALGDVAAAVLRRAYEQLGIELIVRRVPLRRSLLMANAGEVDGEMMRTLAALAEMQQLIPVRVPVLLPRFMVYRLGSCPASVSMADVEASRSSYVRGTRAVEMRLPANSLQPTTTTLDGLRSVQHGQAAQFVGTELETDAVLSRPELRPLCKVAEPLFSVELYHSLHRRHTELVPRLEAVMRQMGERGETARIWAAAGQQLRQNLMMQNGP